MEYDTVVSGKRSGSKAAAVVFIDRATRLYSATLTPNLKPENVNNALLRGITGMRLQVVNSLTGDNGQENRCHRALTKALLAPVFFTDPYSSWQKGSVEHGNKMLRRYFPKGTDFAKITQTELDYAVGLINNKPRKILGYKSALELAREKGLVGR